MFGCQRSSARMNVHERQLLDQRAVALLGLGQPGLAQLQRLLRELALGDVLHLVDEVEGPVALVVGPDERGALMHPHRVARASARTASPAGTR